MSGAEPVPATESELMQYLADTYAAHAGPSTMARDAEDMQLVQEIQPVVEAAPAPAAAFYAHQSVARYVARIACMCFSLF